MKNENLVKIRKVLKFVWESKQCDFYRNKYQKESIHSWRDVKSREDFLNLPFLTREELAKISPIERFYLEPNAFSEIGFSSGTSLNPPVLSLRRPGIRGGKSRASSFFLSGSTVLFLHSANRLVNFYEKLSKFPVTMVVGELSNLPGTAYLASLSGIDALTTSPSMALVFGEHLGKIYDLSRIKIIHLMGEMITEERQRKLRLFYPKAKFYVSYALSETRGLGIACPDLVENKTGFYHPSSSIFYELIDGELVVTHLKLGFIGTPLVRYRTGDAALFDSLDKRCRCGRKNVFKILGRVGHDIVKAFGMEVHADVLEAVLGNLPGVGDFCLHIYEENIVLEVVLKEPQIDHVVLEEQIKFLPLIANLSLSELLTKGKIKDFKVKFLDKILRPDNKKVILRSHLD